MSLPENRGPPRSKRSRATSYGNQASAPPRAVLNGDSKGLNRHSPLLQTSRWREKVKDRSGTEPIKRFAYVSLFFGNCPDVFVGLMCVGWALTIRHTTKTKHELTLMHARDVPHGYLTALSLFWELLPVAELSFDHLVTEGAKPSLKRLFMKLRVFELIQYSKVFFLDADILVRARLDDVFELEASAGVLYPTKDLAGDGTFYPTKDLVKEGSDDLVSRVNAGALLLEPCLQTFAKVCKKAAELGQDGSQASRCPEEVLLTHYFASECGGLRTLGIRWNLELWRRQQVTKHDIETARIYHFSCSRLKPWWSAWSRNPDNVKEEMLAWAKQRLNDDQLRNDDPHQLLPKATAEWASAFARCYNWVTDVRKVDILAIVRQHCSALEGEAREDIGGLKEDVRCQPWPCTRSDCTYNVDWAACTEDAESCGICHSHHGVYEGSGEFKGVFYCEPCWEDWLYGDTD